MAAFICLTVDVLLHLFISEDSLTEGKTHSASTNRACEYVWVMACWEETGWREQVFRWLFTQSVFVHLRWIIKLYPTQHSGDHPLVHVNRKWKCFFFLKTERKSLSLKPKLWTKSQLCLYINMGIIRAHKMAQLYRPLVVGCSEGISSTYLTVLNALATNWKHKQDSLE